MDPITFFGSLIFGGIFKGKNYLDRKISSELSKDNNGDTYRGMHGELRSKATGLKVSYMNGNNNHQLLVNENYKIEKDYTQSLVDETAEELKIHNEALKQIARDRGYNFYREDVNDSMMSNGYIHNIGLYKFFDNDKEFLWTLDEHDVFGSFHSPYIKDEISCHIRAFQIEEGFKIKTLIFCDTIKEAYKNNPDLLTKFIKSLRKIRYKISDSKIDETFSINHTDEELIDMLILQ